MRLEKGMHMISQTEGSEHGLGFRGLGLSVSGFGAANHGMNVGGIIA